MELATPGLKQPKNGDPVNIVKFHAALQDKKISSSSIEEIKSAVKYAMVKIGLRAQNFPSEEEKAVLIDHILKNYSGHTVGEIRLAFDMAIEGKLDVDATCYENFSCLYFSKIISAYREYSKEEYKQLELPAPKNETEKKEDMSDTAMDDWFQKTCKRVKSGECTVEFIPLMLYEWKDAREEIKKTSSEKREYLVKAAAHRYEALLCECTNKPTTDNKRTFEQYSKMNDGGCFTGKEIDILKALAKRMILYDIIKGYVPVP